MEWWWKVARKRFRPNSPAAFAFAVLCVGGALLFRLFTGWLLGNTLFFATFFPAILIAALFAGFWAGIAATVLSILTVWSVIIPPSYGFEALSPVQIGNFVLFGISSLMVVWLAAVHRELVDRVQRQENERRLLTRELEHRSKNMLAIIEAIILQSAESGDRDRAHILIERLRTVFSTNELLADSPTHTISLRNILAREIQPYGMQCCTLSGPEVELSGEIARAASLVFHELMTNAAKHGALSRVGGHVKVEWRTADGLIDLLWQENGGPPVAPPARFSFGSRLITRTLRQLGGGIEADFRPEGLSCRIRFAPR